MEEKMNQTFSNINCFSLTADCWVSCKMRLYWCSLPLDKTEFSRGQAVLACSRLKGNHTHDKIAESLETIIFDYGLQNKCDGGIITDNTRNFIMCFENYGIQDDEKEEENDFLDEDIQFFELTADFIKDSEFRLPNHFRCAAHCMYLIAQRDIDSAFKDPVFKKLVY
uniref:Putative LOC100572649 [Acyrthosiphon pisum] n=1 Tax=Lepeophtheirus salmonis TaxID=72036 RepID=A0A0K2TB41_LEPSM